MIQRIQTLYLLLAAGAGVATWFVPFGKTINTSNITAAYLANDNFFLTILIVLAVALALLCIFLFKNRKLQLRLSVLGLLVSIGIIVLEYFFISGKQQAADTIRAHYSLGIAFPVLMLLFFLLAIRGIYKDEKLVRSLDRLR